MSFKAELEHIKNKLASKIDELERLKSDTTSADLAQPRFAITRDDKKNTQNEEQPLLCRLFKGDSLSHNNLAQYFVYRKSIEESKISDSQSKDGKASKTNISETNKDNIFQPQEIIELPWVKNVTPFLLADSPSPSPIESQSQILVEEIPVVSILGSPIFALLLLALLIIATI